MPRVGFERKILVFERYKTAQPLGSAFRYRDHGPEAVTCRRCVTVLAVSGTRYHVLIGVQSYDSGRREFRCHELQSQYTNSSLPSPATPPPAIRLAIVYVT
jgi:hypothetical protein